MCNELQPSAEAGRPRPQGMPKARCAPTASIRHAREQNALGMGEGMCKRRGNDPRARCFAAA